MGRFRYIFLIIAATLSSCIKLPQTFQRLSYHEGRIRIDKERFYRVGPLGPRWSLSKSTHPDVRFYHRDLGASIATSALCGTQFEDLPLPKLTQNLLADLAEVSIRRQTTLTLDGREALHTRASAKVDGVPVDLETVVVKKNGCQFDFMSVGKTGEDFLKFYSGFEY